MKTAAMFSLFFIFAMLGNSKALRFGELYATPVIVTLLADAIVAGALTILLSPLI